MASLIIVALISSTFLWLDAELVRVPANRSRGTLGARLTHLVHGLPYVVARLGIVAHDQTSLPSTLAIIRPSTSNLRRFCPNNLCVVARSVAKLEGLDVGRVKARISHFIVPGSHCIVHSAHHF